MVGFDHPLAQAALREVVDLHAFFERWLGGTTENTDAVLHRLESALGEAFTMVSPAGESLRRSDVIEWLRDTHGAKSQQGAFQITITEPELLLLQPPLVLLGYVEEQSTGGALTRRRSTALFEAAAEAEEGVRWLALHETWISPDR
jgi:hypothetical protein